MKAKTLYKTFLIISVILVFCFSGCGSKEKQEDFSDNDQVSAEGEKTAAPYNLAVIVPGVAAGSPIYEQLVSGAERAVEAAENASMKVIELGYNQAEWTEKMTAIVATGLYDAVITSNPSMPYICMDISNQFPDQKFIFVDAFIEGNNSMTSYLYNQVEQSYMLGHLAGLITESNMEGAVDKHKIGIIVAQEYPALNKMMVPGFLKGAQSVNSNIELDYRVLGNWYDAAKAAELARSMIDSGVDVIGVICGGAATGVFDVCGERGKYVMYWDENGYSKSPGVIAGCGSLMQERLVFEVVTDAINGKIEWGKANKLNTKDGYIDFISDDPDYIKTVPADLREKQSIIVEHIKTGHLVLEIPEL